MAGRTDSGSSITNVAATAGVSIATVSRVLSGKRGKDDDIARRVREAAKQLGYSVNYAASALRSDVTKTIGLVIPSATEPFAAQLLDEIEPTIDTESQQLLLGIGATQEAQAERIESLANRHVDGLIVVPAAGADLAGTLNQYANTLPIVQICGRQTAPRVSVVGIDENAAMEAIVKHLAEQGIVAPVGPARVGRLPAIIDGDDLIIEVGLLRQQALETGGNETLEVVDRNQHTDFHSLSYVIGSI